MHMALVRTQRVLSVHDIPVVLVVCIQQVVLSVHDTPVVQVVCTLEVSVHDTRVECSVVSVHDTPEE